MIKFETMSEVDYEDYLKAAIKSYAGEHIKAGNWTEENGYEKAVEQYKRLLPDGVATKNHYLFNILTDEEKVGILWVHSDPNQNQQRAFI